MNGKMLYEGFNQDPHGMTILGRIELDAWLFDLLPRSEDCTGCDLQRMQKLMDQVNNRWDENGNIPSRLASVLLEKHTVLFDWATRRARVRGWDPELGEDD